MGSIRDGIKKRDPNRRKRATGKRGGATGGTGILFEEPNPTGSRPRDLIGLYRQQKKPHPPNTQGRARREHGGEQGHPGEAESHPEEEER